MKSSLTALLVTVCIIEAPARCARLGPSMGINHILHQQPTYIASAPFKTPTDFFANNYLQHASNITFMLQKYRAQINTRSAPFEASPFDSWITASGKRKGFPTRTSNKVSQRLKFHNHGEGPYYDDPSLMTFASVLQCPNFMYTYCGLKPV